MACWGRSAHTKVTVLSASPELFIEQEGRIVSTRPMKGTAPRAGTIEADAEARRQLATDVKQRAENLMIVDLMRNDIGRIAEIGSVSVTDLFTVETFQQFARRHSQEALGALAAAPLQEAA